MTSSTSSAGAGRGTGLRIATRGSPLARRQAELVAALLGTAAGPLVLVETAGDQRRAEPISRLGGQGVFVGEVRRAVLDGRADIAVHSAKDLPASTDAAGPDADGLVIAAVPVREDPRDVLVGSRLRDLGPGALVATGSVRRRAQLAWLRPDLGFAGLRGNIGTRLGRVPAGGAMVTALAALRRLDLASGAVGGTLGLVEILSTKLMLPQVGQGALAVECRAGDGGAVAALRAIDHQPSHRELRAERAFLAAIGGGCDAPVGALAVAAPGSGGIIEIEGLLASADGHVILRRSAVGDEPEAVGAALAADLLDHAGGRSLLGAAW